MSHEGDVLWAAWRRRYPRSAALEDALHAAGGTATQQGRELWERLRSSGADAMRDWAGIVAFVARYKDVNVARREGQRLDELCRRHGYRRFIDVHDGCGGLRGVIGVVDSEDNVLAGRRDVPMPALVDAERHLLEHLEREA